MHAYENKSYRGNGAESLVAQANGPFRSRSCQYITERSHHKSRYFSFSGRRHLARTADRPQAAGQAQGTAKDDEARHSWTLPAWTPCPLHWTKHRGQWQPNGLRAPGGWAWRGRTCGHGPATRREIVWQCRGSVDGGLAVRAMLARPGRRAPRQSHIAWNPGMSARGRCLSRAPMGSKVRRILR